MADRATFKDVEALAMGYLSQPNPSKRSAVVATASLREMLMVMGQKRWNVSDLSDQQWLELLDEMGFDADEAQDALEDIAQYGSADIARS